MYIPDGNKIKAARVAKHLTQSKLGKLVGASQSWVGRLEKETLPSFERERMAAMYKILGIKEEDVSTGEKYPMAHNEYYCECCGVLMHRRAKYCEVCIVDMRKAWSGKIQKPVRISKENIPDYENETFTTVKYNKPIGRRKIQYKVNPNVAVDENIEVMPCKSVQNKHNGHELQDWLNEV